MAVAALAFTGEVSLRRGIDAGRNDRDAVEISKRARDIPHEPPGAGLRPQTSVEADIVF
jgi:hypothetical protein